MSEENRFIKNKKMVALSISLVVMCVLAGVLGGSIIMITGNYNNVSGDYDELYIDYLELLYDFNNLDERYFALTGEHIELENEYNVLVIALNNMTAQRDALEIERDELLQNIIDLEDIIVDLNVQINNLNIQIADLNDIITGLEDDYDILEIAYNDLLNTYNTLLAGLTLTYIETLCNADTYVSDMESWMNFGSEQYWKAGYDEYTWEYCIAFFNFSLLNKPETYEKVEIQLSLSYYELGGYGGCFPVKYFQEWNEDTLLYNNTINPDIDPLSFSLSFNMITYSFKIIIDVTEWVNTGVDSISIAFSGGYYYEGYSREHPNQDVVPKLVWTIINISI